MPEDDPDIVFLSSSLNNMLVCGILKGIHLSLASADSKSDIDYIKNWQEHTDSSEGKHFACLPHLVLFVVPLRPVVFGKSGTNLLIGTNRIR